MIMLPPIRRLTAGFPAFALAAAAALSVSARAEAGQLSELSCPIEALSPADRSALGAVLTTRVGDRAAVQRAGAAAVSTCTERFGWSGDEARAANAFMAAALMQTHYREILVGRGVDAAWLEREVAADTALVAAAAALIENPPEFEAFRVRVLSRLEERHQVDAALRYAIGAFVFSTAFAQDARRRFAAD